MNEVARLLAHDDSHDAGGSAILRQWELNSNSTRYDRIQAAPSDGDLLVMRIIWSAILFSVSCLTVLLLLAIIRAPAKVRKSTFNTYLFYLVIPDCVFSVGCFTTCVTNAFLGLTDWMCHVQHIYLIFRTGVNCWLNAVVAWQLYLLLRKSRFPDLSNRSHYKAPTHKDAQRHAMMVYADVLFIGTLYYIPK